MTQDPRDRLLEYALETLHREEEEPDLAPRIAEAWHRDGPIEVSAEVLDPTFPSLPSGDEGSSLRPRPLPRIFRGGRIAAAALVIVALAVSLWIANRPAPTSAERLARANTPVMILHESGALPRFDTRILAGDEIVVPSGAEVEFLLESGDRLVADGSTLFRIRPPEVELLVGTLQIEKKTSEPLRITSDFAEAVASAPGFFMARLEVDPGREIPLGFTDPNLAKSAFDKGIPLPRLLSIQVKKGALELSRGEKRERIEAGSKRQLWSDEYDSEKFTKGEEAKARELLLALLKNNGAKRFSSKLAPSSLPGGRKSAYDLDRLLASRPKYWATVREEALKVADEPKVSASELSNIVEFLLHHPSDEAFELGRDTWMVRPDAFREHQIVGFAERGASELQRELGAMVDLADVDSSPPILAAAWLGQRGDRKAITVLEQFLETSPPKSELVLPWLLAAGALASSGDDQAWGRAREHAQWAVEDSLAQKDIGRAAAVVLVLDLLDQARMREEGIAIGTLFDELDSAFEREKTTLSSPERIREFLNKLL